jgi:hypothetical protein
LIGVAYSNHKDPKTPNNILLAGLAFQVFSFAVFVLCLSAFQWKLRKVTSSALKSFSSALCVETLMEYLRACFRLAETAQGLQHYFWTDEVFFGYLEFAPIVAAVYIFLYWHPGRSLGSKVATGKCFQNSLVP